MKELTTAQKVALSLLGAAKQPANFHSTQVKPIRVETTRFSVSIPYSTVCPWDFSAGELQLMLTGEAEVSFFHEAANFPDPEDNWEEVKILSVWVTIEHPEAPAEKTVWFKVAPSELLRGMDARTYTLVITEVEEDAKQRASEDQGESLTLPTQRSDADNIWHWATPNSPVGNVQRIMRVGASTL